MADAASRLATYNAKRDFSVTPEPAGEPARRSAGDLFIVQKHEATRLHWDLRLEIDGVLVSWAVTKGPSNDPSIKRLAVRTEDHPLSYAEFEGTIPRKAYGGGTVMLWDRGRWRPIEGKSASDLAEGHLHFVLEGERMRGEWLLVRLKPKPCERRENWLLRKIDDAYAGSGDALVQRNLTSVTTGRSMAMIAAGIEPAAGDFANTGSANTSKRRGKGKGSEAGRGKPERLPAARREKRGLPGFRELQLATLAHSVPEGPGWMHEIKFDGYRALIAASGGEVRIYTRSGLDWSDKFEPLRDAIAKLALPSCLIDGEIVAVDANGNPDFGRLQALLKRGRSSIAVDDPVAFHAFDLLELDGDDWTGASNLERKAALDRLLAGASSPIHVAQHIEGAGERLLSAMCAANQEGIVSKRCDAPYSAGRGRDWLKIKCVQRDIFVVIGWKPSSSRARPFASLHLAQFDAGQLVYRGAVGSGFTGDQLVELAGKLRRLERKTSPIAAVPDGLEGLRWVTPKLVIEVAYAQDTAAGRLRHASFVGLRPEIDPNDAIFQAGDPLSGGEASVSISHRERVLFPDSGTTKGALADYYAAIGSLLLEHGGARPLALVRCPEGRAKECFFQKNYAETLGKAVVPVRLGSRGSKRGLALETTTGISQCVQMGTIEFHGWCAPASSISNPDRMVFDLDPDEGLEFETIKSAAIHIRDALADLGLVSFAMLTGGKGVHVVVPVRSAHGWERHTDFARRFAKALSIAEPKRFTASMSKANRQGRIFIDWLRNKRGATAVLPYSVRARPRAPVAVPIAWRELDDLRSADAFTIDDSDVLLSRARSVALRDWGQAEQDLPDI